jgi:integrase
MNEKIRVHVVKYQDCKNLILRYKDPTTGKYFRKSSGTTNRKEARKEAGKWEDELQRNGPRNRESITWEAFRDRYEREVVPSLAPRTGDKIASVLNGIESTLPKIKAGLLRDLTAERLSEWQTQLRVAGRSEATIAGHCAHLRAALAWAADQGLIPALPKIRKPKRARGSGGSDPMKGRPICREEFERMLDAIPKALTIKAWNDQSEKWETTPPTPEAAESWRHLLNGLWWSGLRLGEALNLEWDKPDAIHVDLTEREPMLFIPGPMQKSGKDQLYAVAPEFSEFLLATHASRRHGRVFRPLAHSGEASQDFVCKAITKIGKAAGVKVRVETGVDPETGKEAETVKYASAHDLRRSFGERWSLLVLPQVLMELMRHASIVTTQRYYVGRNAQRTANVVRAAYEKSRAGTVSGTVGPKREPDGVAENDVSCYAGKDLEH